jgi:LmbE family N-acetylglucosaminyl deacetylase
MWRRFAIVATVTVMIVWAVQPSPALPLLRLSASAATRLLVLAPHPDDEGLAAAGLIERVRSTHGRVRVVVMTSGDALPSAAERLDATPTPGAREFRTLARVRERESRTAMATLGLGADDVVFLGFPDEGLCLLASAFLSARSAPLTSPFSARTQPPSDEQIVRGVTYRGSDVRLELERVLTAFSPTVVVLPDPEDEHPDHCASYIFIRAALDRVAADRSRPRLLRYVVHVDDWPPDGESAATPLMPPRQFDEPTNQWRTFPLTIGEARTKKAALGAYATQWAVVGPLLRGFTRPNEIFLEGDPAHAPECWCDAEHVATELPPIQRRRHPPVPAR